jgi:hypothetical protein
MKRCSKCGEDKPRATFSKNTKSTDGLQHYCKPCSSSAGAINRAAKPEKYKSIRRKSNLKQYGLTPDDFHKIVEDQGSSCAICFKPLDLSFKGRNTAFAVDHNHSTGEVRGVLCPKCNMGIGSLGDNPVVLRSAAKYLESRGHYGC